MSKAAPTKTELYRLLEKARRHMPTRYSCDHDGYGNLDAQCPRCVGLHVDRALLRTKLPADRKRAKAS